MVWIIECRATDSLHKTCGNDTSLPSKQKKISHKVAMDLTTRQNNCELGKKLNKNVAFQLCSTHVLFTNITSKKRQNQRQDRTGHLHVNSKEEWNMFYDGVNHREQSNQQFTQDLRQWHTSSIEAEKKYLTRKHWTLQHATTTANREKNPTKKSPFNYFQPMCYSQTSQAKSARCRDRREQVISTPTPKRSGTCFTMVWIIECRATDSLHETCGNDTSLPAKQKKTSHKEALELKTRQKNCKPGTMSKQKFAFQICLTHVLFPNITSIKRQMQRQERTGHFHVNSKEEWNMFYDGVNNRVQSNRQFTQDLRQWHKSSIEAEKKSHKVAMDLTTRQNNCELERNWTKMSPFSYVRPMCYSQTSQAKNARCRDRREQVISTSTPKRSGT